MSRSYALHVLPMGPVWKVAPPGNSQPFSYHATKLEALEHARQLALEHAGGRVVVHAADGSVETEQVVGERERG